MKRTVLWYCLLILIAAMPVPAQQTQTKTASEYYEIARKAYADKDYEAYVKNLQAVVQAGTTHPIIFYDLAAGYALLGKKQESVLWLNRIADLGIMFPAADDQDFASIRNTPEFAQVLARFQQNLKPTDRSKIAFTIPENDFVAEGVAYDPTQKLFYSGSILKHKIVSIDSTGKIQDFSSNEDGLWSVLGMSVDPARQTLWVSTANFPELEKGKNQAAIVKYDLKSKKVLGRYEPPETEAGNQFGDVIVNSAGDAFTTDSLSPAVYTIPHETNKLELFIGGDLFRSPQGLCFSGDEKTLYVADYTRGIFAIDLKNKSHVKLTVPVNTTVVGIDGLYFYKDSLIATQNGVKPNRVLRLFLNKEKNGIERVGVLESNHKLFGEITLGTIMGDSLYYVANSQFGEYVNNPKTELHAPLILKLPLD
jgi:sugar lactone lactonase YvrE